MKHQGFACPTAHKDGGKFARDHKLFLIYGIYLCISVT